jgi:hypothetical protein
MPLEAAVTLGSETMEMPSAVDSRIEVSVVMPCLNEADTLEALLKHKKLSMSTKSKAKSSSLTMVVPTHLQLLPPAGERELSMLKQKDTGAPLWAGSLPHGASLL